MLENPDNHNHNAIRDWFAEKIRQMGYIVEVEKKLKWHKIDVVVNNKIGIEIQLSPMDNETFYNRNMTFISNGITPVWILSGDFFDRAYSSTVNKEHQRFTKLELEINKNLVLPHKEVFYYGDGWIWRSDLVKHNYLECSGWYNLKRCGFNTQIKNLLRFDGKNYFGITNGVIDEMMKKKVKRFLNIQSSNEIDMEEHNDA